MGNFTFEEMNLMCIYNTGSRTGLIDSLREMRGELAPEETELRELTDSALGKLQAMSDAEFAELELYPDLTSKHHNRRDGVAICYPIFYPKTERRTEHYANQS